MDESANSSLAVSVSRVPDKSFTAKSSSDKPALDKSCLLLCRCIVGQNLFFTLNFLLAEVRFLLCNT